MLADLFKDASLLPHGFCLLWDPWLISAHLFSDLAIFLAYAAIPIAIYIFLRKRPALAMSNLAWLFALFILFCGITHLASAVALYLPIYELQAGIKVATAGISLATAFVIFPLIPKALAIPSPDELQRVISQLQTEVESHQQTEHELRTARDELQKLVQEQTTALARASSVIAALDESASILIFVKDNDGKMLMANPAAIAATGRTAEEVIGKDDSEFLNQPEEIEKIREVDRLVRETGLPVKAAEKVTQPDGTERVYLSTKVPLRDLDGAVDGIVGVSVDVTEREALLEKLTRSEENLRLGTEAASFGSCEFSPAEQQLQVSRSLQRMLGLSQETVSLDDFLETVTHEDRIAVSEALHTQTSAEIEFRGRGQDGSACWYLLRGQNLSTDGVGRFWGAIVDITRRKRAEHRTADLMRELIHRGRNLLTVVQVLARNSLTPPRTLAEARDIFIERLHAFARGYEIFVDGDHVGLTFKDLILAEANRFPGQFTLTGPEFILNERAAQTLGLVIHELTTNAAKHGALSKPTGQVLLEWTVDESGGLHFKWKEIGGPAVTAPTRKGFGTGLIERILKTDFSARPRWQFAPEGYRFAFEAPLSKLRAESVGPNNALQELVTL